MSATDLERELNHIPQNARGHQKNSFLKPGGSQMEGTHTMGPSHVLLDMYNSKFASNLHIIFFPVDIFNSYQQLFLNSPFE